MVAPFSKCKEPRFNPFKDKKVKRARLAKMKERLKEAQSRGRKHHKNRMTERQKRALEARDDALRAGGGRRKPVRRKPNAEYERSLAGQLAKLRREGQHSAASRLEAQMSPEAIAAAREADEREAAAVAATDAKAAGKRNRQAMEAAADTVVARVRPQKQPRVVAAQLSAQQEAMRQAAAATIELQSTVDDATATAWVEQRTLTQQLVEQVWEWG